MKYFRRFLLLFSCVLLLSIAFSSIVSAEQLENGSYRITATIGDSNSFINDSITFIPNNGTRERTIQRVSVAPSDNNGYKFSGSWTIERLDSAPIVEKGQKTTVTIEDGYLSLLKHSPTTTYYRIPTVKILIRYMDYSYEYIDECIFTNDTGLTHLEFTFTPKANVKWIKYHFTWEIPWEGETTSDFTYYLGEYYQDNSYNLVINQQSEEASLLDGIKGVLSNVLEWIKNIANSIAELPAKLWEKIETGLHNLFVPSEESITDFKSRMETMLNDRLGAVYEVVEITFDSWDRIDASDTRDTIEMPLTTIPLPDNNEFSFGGYDVKVVPDGFEFMTVATKTITAIVCTVYFVNGLRKRYDEVMGVEQ